MIVDYAEDGEVVYGQATDLYGKYPKRSKTYTSRHDHLATQLDLLRFY